MTDLSVPWGDGPLEFSLPEDWELVQTANSTLRAAPEDWPDRLAMALNQPEAGLPLSRLLAARRGGNIVLVVEDLTRHSPLPQILSILLREIRHAEIQDSQIEIIFATGMHPPLTPEEADRKLGPEVASIRRRCNACRDPAASVKIGSVGSVPVRIDRAVAAADLRIVVSSVSPHLQAGFGGGYKMILLGCASAETIRGLHRQGIGRSLRQQVGTDVLKNPMRMAIDSGGAMLEQAGGATFSVQYLLDDRELPCAIATGEVLPAHRMLAKQAAVFCGVIVPSPSDVLIANAHPRDFDLWQSFKCIANTLWAAREGGVVICLTRCPGGINNVKPMRWPLSPKATRTILRVLGPQNLAQLVMRLVPRMAGDAAFFVRIASGALHRNPILMVCPELARQGAVFPGMPIFPDVPQAFAAATKILGPGRQRVTLFPSGGITYPIPGFKNGGTDYAS